MTKTPTTTPTLQPDPLAAALAAEEARLRAALAGSPLLQLETERTLAEFERTALLLREALARTLATDFTPVELASLAADQLARDAAVLLDNAQRRADAARSHVRTVWADRLATERARRQRAQRQAAR